MSSRSLRSILLILIFICSLSCNITSPPPGEDKIIGRWSWLESCCGFGGDLRTPENTGHKIEIRFTSSNNYYQYDDGLLKRDTYYGISRKIVWGEEESVVLKIENDSPEMVIQFNSADTLILTDTCIDCYRHLYVRIGK